MQREHRKKMPAKSSLQGFADLLRALLEDLRCKIDRTNHKQKYPNKQQESPDGDNTEGVYVPSVSGKVGAHLLNVCVTSVQRERVRNTQCLLFQRIKGRLPSHLGSHFIAEDREGAVGIMEFGVNLTDLI